MFKPFVRLCRLLSPALLFVSCRSGQETVQPDALFQLQPSEQTGIHFNNRVTDGTDFNIFKYRNFYNGGGVGIGDVNNDGLPDIFFTSNQEANQLYLNRGNWKFEEAASHAGLISSHH